MKKGKALSFIIILCSVTVYGQSTESEIQRLQTLAKACEQEAIKNAAYARKAEMELRIIRYLSIANELAEQSIEVQEKDIAALMAMQAYNFKVQYDGTFFSNKIYNAILGAMKRYDLDRKNVSSDAEEKYLLTKAKPIFSAMLPDSSASVVADQNGYLRFETKHGLTVRTLSGHRAQVDQIVFSHSGKFMATSGKDNAIRIWKLNQLNLRPLVIKESDQINKLMFSADDSYIFYTRGIKQVTINQLPVDLKLMATDLCNAQSRNFTEEEWRTYVAIDLPYEKTCSGK